MILRKSLGQHFLKDEEVSRKILSALEEYHFKRLLEVGAGGGALTKYLLKIPGVELKAVEVDLEKFDYLLSTYPGLKGRLIHADFLSMDKPFDDRFTIVGNFPYNISSQIIFRAVEWKEHVECMIGMFQKEVAQRIAAPEGNKVYGVISVLVQAFYEVEYLFEVPQTAFIPPPKVRSAVIRLMPRKNIPAMRNEKDLFLLVKTAFNQRRKTLRNAVRGLFDESYLKKEIFNKRAEQLGVGDFAALTFEMK